jgi:hypothetical protein
MIQIRIQNITNKFCHVLPEIKLQLGKKDLPKGARNPLKIPSNPERILFRKYITVEYWYESIKCFTKHFTKCFTKYFTKSTFAGKSSRIKFLNEWIV